MRAREIKDLIIVVISVGWISLWHANVGLASVNLLKKGRIEIQGVILFYTLLGFYNDYSWMADCCLLIHLSIKMTLQWLAGEALVDESE